MIYVEKVPLAIGWRQDWRSQERRQEGQLEGAYRL